MTPEHLFDEFLPAFARVAASQPVWVARVDLAALASRASIAVDTKAWTLSLHDVDRPVRQGGDVDAAVHVWLSREAFDALAEGRIADVRPPAIGLRTRSGKTSALRYVEQLGRLLE